MDLAQVLSLKDIGVGAILTLAVVLVLKGTYITQKKADKEQAEIRQIYEDRIREIAQFRQIEAERILSISEKRIEDLHATVNNYEAALRFKDQTIRAQGEQINELLAGNRVIIPILRALQPPENSSAAGPERQGTQ